MTRVSLRGVGDKRPSCAHTEALQATASMSSSPAASPAQPSLAPNSTTSPLLRGYRLLHTPGTAGHTRSHPLVLTELFPQEPWSTSIPTRIWGLCTRRQPAGASAEPALRQPTSEPLPATDRQGEAPAYGTASPFRWERIFSTIKSNCPPHVPEHHIYTLIEQLYHTTYVIYITAIQ